MACDSVRRRRPWVEREVTWNHYYLRSGFTYDDFFKQHIVSQASIYQYVMGFQGAARDRYSTHCRFCSAILIW